MLQTITVIRDREDGEESVFESSEVDQNQEIVEVEFSSVEEYEEEEEIAVVPFAVIEEVSIYTGCATQPNNALKNNVYPIK